MKYICMSKQPIRCPNCLRDIGCDARFNGDSVVLTRIKIVKI